MTEAIEKSEMEIVFEKLLAVKASAACNVESDKLSVRSKITRVAYKIIRDALRVFKQSRAKSATEEDLDEMLTKICNVKEVTEDEQRLIDQGVKRRMKQKETRDKKKAAKDAAAEKVEKVKPEKPKKVKKDGDEAKTTTPKKKDVPKKKATVLVKRTQSALDLDDREKLVCCLHLGEMSEEIVDKVGELTHAQEKNDDGNTISCFSCKEVKPILYSTGCCSFTIKICESCVNLFSWSYVTTTDVGRRMPIGSFSCYNCQKKFACPSDTPAKEEMENYLDGSNKFFAKVWVNILEKIKPTILSGREELLESIANWALKTLSDDISPAHMQFLEDVIMFKTTKKDFILTCKDKKNKGEDYLAFMNEEREKKMKRSKRKIALKPKIAATSSATDAVEMVTKIVENESMETDESTPVKPVEDEKMDETEQDVTPSKPKPKTEEETFSTPPNSPKQAAKRKIDDKGKSAAARRQQRAHDVSDSESDDDEAATPPPAKLSKTEPKKDEKEVEDIDESLSFGDGLKLDEDDFGAFAVPEMQPTSFDDFELDDELNTPKNSPKSSGDNNDGADAASITLGFGDELEGIL